MKSYFIFAIILTAIYVVYYAANIARDLLEKPRDFDPFGQTGLSPLATI